MFDFLFPPKCPVDDATRGWVRDRYAWLTARFGDEAFLQPMVLPTTEFFPERFDGSLAALESVMHRIAERLGVASSSLQLELFDDGDAYMDLLRQNQLEGRSRTEGAAGWFAEHESYSGFSAQFRIALGQSAARDPVVAVATLAHEVCHALLLGDHHLEGHEEDLEPLTDLATVFFGFGVFTANAGVREQAWQQGALHGWRIARHGYLPASTVGFALAWHAALRRESSPAWAGRLRADVRAPFRKAQRYLRQPSKRKG
jgi:hypothetical protein